jgi:hypothetical protein
VIAPLVLLNSKSRPFYPQAELQWCQVHATRCTVACLHMTYIASLNCLCRLEG